MKNKFLKKKWLTSMILTIVLVAIIVCAYAGILYGMSKLNIDDLDFTKEKIYSISQATKDRLQNLEQDVTITIYNMYDYVKDYAYKYANLNSHIKVEELESLTTKTDWKASYGVTETSAFMVIQTEGREKILYDSDLSTYDYSTYEQIDITEEAMTNAILDVTTNVKPKICFLTGHELYSSQYFQYLENALTEEINEVVYTDVLKTGKVPDDCKLLVITTLKEDITEKEKDSILSYIHNGGELLLLVEPNLGQIKTPNFNKILEEYGVSVSESYILEGDTNKMVSGAPSFVISTINSSSEIAKNISMGLNVCMMNPAKLILESDDKLAEKNVTVEVLATVSEKAFYRKDTKIESTSRVNTDEDASGATVAAMLTKENSENKTSKMIIFANTAFSTNVQIPINNSYYMYALDYYNNKDILLNTVSYLTEREDNITIRKTGETVTTYELTEGQTRLILGIIFTIPVLIIIVGIVVWMLRRRKK